MLIGLLFTNPIFYLMTAIAILFAFTIHEYFHAQAAYSLGDPTAKNAGRLTVNPLAHFDPFGTLLIFIIGIGYGKPVPFNPYNLKNQKWGPALVGLAGPASNFLCALIVGLLLRFLTISNPMLTTFFSIFVWLNLSLGVFNLLPIPPLDGSHIFSSIAPSFTEKFGRTPFLIIIAFIFMIYIGVPYICQPLFTIITGTSLPF
jgi:Zn-dependent protease